MTIISAENAQDDIDMNQIDLIMKTKTFAREEPGTARPECDIVHSIPLVIHS